jgi:hypothetical protein
MKILRTLPFLALTGAAVLVYGMVDAAIKDFESIDTNDLDDIKSIQNELARLYDVKILNDKLEATAQVRKTVLTVGGVEIKEAIDILENRLEQLVKKNRSKKKNKK